MQRTKWYPMKINPVRVGWYEWENSSALRYWDGELWLDTLFKPMCFFRRWRGVLK